MSKTQQTVRARSEFRTGTQLLSREKVCAMTLAEMRLIAGGRCRKDPLADKQTFEPKHVAKPLLIVAEDVE